MLAASYGHANVINVLVDAGADTEAKPDDGNTPLIVAAYNGRSAAVKALLDAGANKDAKNNAGNTALIYAAGEGHAAVVKVLLDAGADKEAKSAIGCTAFTWAASKGQYDFVRFILEKSRTEEYDRNAKEAVIYAACNGQTALVKQLLFDKKNLCSSAVLLLKQAIAYHRVGTVRALLGISSCTIKDLKAGLKNLRERTAQEQNAAKKKKLEQLEKKIKLLIGHAFAGPNSGHQKLFKAIKENDLKNVYAAIKTIKDIHIYDKNDEIHWQNPLHTALQKYESITLSLYNTQQHLTELREQQRTAECCYSRAELATNITAAKKQINELEAQKETSRKIFGLLLSINPALLHDTNEHGTSPYALMHGRGYQLVKDINDIMANKSTPATVITTHDSAFAQLMARYDVDDLTQEELGIIAELEVADTKEKKERTEAIYSLQLEFLQEQEELLNKKQQNTSASRKNNITSMSISSQSMAPAQKGRTVYSTLAQPLVAASSISASSTGPWTTIVPHERTQNTGPRLLKAMDLQWDDHAKQGMKTRGVSTQEALHVLNTGIHAISRTSGRPIFLKDGIVVVTDAQKSTVISVFRLKKK